MNHTFKEIKVKNIKLYNMEECHFKNKNNEIHFPKKQKSRGFSFKRSILQEV